MEGLSFDSSGNLYASDNNTGGIEKYSPSGSIWGRSQDLRPIGIAFDSLGDLWSGAGTGRIEQFSPTGEHLGGFGVGGRDIVIVPGPVLVDQCRNGGWSPFEFPRAFKSEGDCKQFVNTGK